MSSPKQSNPIKHLMIANRGEIVIRIARTARELGMETLAVYALEDEDSAHLQATDRAHRLQGQGAAAYLDIEQLIEAALAHGCDAVHPGYGFLSENSEFARRCEQAGLIFVGPSAELIDLYGDKSRAREVAKSCGVSVAAGTNGPTTLQQAREFLESLGSGGATMIKALAGGGGRGMRVVKDVGELDTAYKHCQSEARRSFGRDEVYVERYIQRARHIEVQIVGDGQQVAHLWERECTLQRQHQKLVEMAPSPNLDSALRHRLLEAACRMAAYSGYQNLGTFEFLVDLDRLGQPDEFCFMEANPRIQVEHTVTEEVLGLDLVEVQLRLAEGQSLSQLSLLQEAVPQPWGHAIQLRINMESMDEQGRLRPSRGTIDRFVLPGGPGVRVDTFGYAGYPTVTQFDSLLAKLIVHSPSPDFQPAWVRACRAADEFIIDGVTTNLPFLRSLLQLPEVQANEVNTKTIEQNITSLVAQTNHSNLRGASGEALLAEGLVAVSAPLGGLISAVNVVGGQQVDAGDELMVIEAMKMEHAVPSPHSGTVRDVLLAAGDLIDADQLLILLEPADGDNGQWQASQVTHDPDYIRDDLKHLQERLSQTLDDNRPNAVERRRQRGQRTARENILDLCDDNSFIEYGQLVVAYQHSRRSHDELREVSPADGFVMGAATINAEQFGPEAASVLVGSYDATVFAGTQGHKNHQKTDRLFDLAGEQKLPVVLFAEGGGGRPREDPVTITGLLSETFIKLARLSGKVPVVGVLSGRCFAGNAALLGLADVIIATRDIAMGMGGPAMIEAAGLGAFSPEEVGSIEVHQRSGVVDIPVEDETEAVAVTKHYLSFFQGRVSEWQVQDERLLRHVIPENRLRAYDIREVVKLLADVDSYLELRACFGQSYVTALIRVEGRPVGVIANNPLFNAGAIDSDGADKAARFLRLCNAHGLPVLSLIDTPGIMVGPDAEKTGLVRHSSRLFAAAANLDIPMFALVIRKAYGLGAMAAAGGHFRAPFYTAAWPSGELGGMGLEGAVRLGYKHELAAIEDPAERQALFEKLVASRYEKGKATFAASYFELDAVIDPADTRRWIVTGLNATAHRDGKSNAAFIDTW